MTAGTSRYASEVVLPAGTTLVSDPKMIVVHVSERSIAVVEEVVAPVAEADAVAPAADAEKKDA